MIAKFFKSYAFLFLVSVCLTGCTLFKKEIKRPVVVYIEEASIRVVTASAAEDTKYTNNLSDDELRSRFLKGFHSEAKITTNITLSDLKEAADFIIKIDKISVSESSQHQKITDEKSPYNGQEVVLNSINCSADVEIINTKTHIAKTCNNSKIRSEKLKNNRDLGDLITGTNKDHTIYRTKLLPNDICLNLSEDVGRRIWVPITRKIAKAIK